MSGLASRMSDLRPLVYQGGPGSAAAVEAADLRTSMCDARAALSVAQGTPLEHIDRDGYTSAEYAAQERAQGRRR